jgi:hypothetical protein
VIAPELAEVLQGTACAGDDGELMGLYSVREGGPAEPVASASLSEAKRKDLLKAARAGEAVELLLDAVTFIQRETPNRNFVRFRPGSLRAMARSFKGQPVLSDHRQRDIRARAGTILASELVEHPDGKAIRQQLHLVKPWAVEGALDGTLDRFSVGVTLSAGADVLCTACGNSMFWRQPPRPGTDPCMHMPGQVVEGKPVEMEYTAAEGIEVSAVSVPAVVGTEIERIHAALSAIRSPGLRPTKEKAMNLLKVLAPLLGLAESATEQDAADALQGVVAEKRGLELKLAAAEERAAEHAASAQALEARVKALEGDVTLRRVDAFIERALAQGKIQPKRDADGKPVAGAMERLLRDMAGRDMKAAEEYLADMPRVVPVAAGAQSERGADKAGRQRVSLTDEQRAACAQLNVKEEDFIKANGLEEAAQ